MSLELVFVTGNQHKLEEVQRMAGQELKLKSLSDIGCQDDIEESGLTFRENAAIKSNYVFSRYKIDCFADDSGLEVDALDGEPGIYSARYSGSRDNRNNLRLILEKLRGITDRKARFRCVISLIRAGQEYFFEGTVEGTILEAESGMAGFGYDPIFVPDGYEKSFAEMPLTEKNKISHRGLAIAKMVDFLTNEP